MGNNRDAKRAEQQLIKYCVLSCKLEPEILDDLTC